MDIVSRDINGYFKIYINELLHLRVYKKDIQGIQSWLDGDNFYIEITTKDNVILSEYNSKEKWEKILSLIDKLE